MSERPDASGNASPEPPRNAVALLERVLPEGVLGRTILGDLRQEFDERVAERGRLRSALWYWACAIDLSVRYSAARPLGRGRAHGSEGSWTTGRPTGRRDFSAGDIMSQWIGDVRYGLRMITRTPLLSITAVLTIAIGVGLTTHAFSVLYGSVIRGPSFDDADRVMVVNRSNAVRNISNTSIPFRDYVDFRDRQTSFASLEAFRRLQVSLAGDEYPPEQYAGARVSAGALDAIGVRPLLGRVFRSGEDGPDAERLVVLSADLWQSRFAGDPSIVGKSVRLNGETHQIIGVLPSGFAFPFNDKLWLTLRLGADVPRGEEPLEAFGRLRDGVTREAALAEFTAINGRLKSAFPETNGEWDSVVHSFVDHFMPKEITAILVMMFTAVFGVLLIACANVANLLTARATTRGREVAIRNALGASRFRVIRQLLAESMVLGLVGGVLGLVLSYWGVEMFNAAILEITKPYWIDIRIDGMVLAFTLGVTLIAALVAGTLPALRASGAGVGVILRDEGRGSSSRRLGRFSRALVVAEVAVSCGLLIASGLMVKSIVTLQKLDRGFTTEGILTGRVNLAAADYPERSDRDRLFAELARRLGSDPGVESVSLSNFLPGTGAARWAFGEEGRTYTSNREFFQVNGMAVSSGFFGTFDVPLLQGRTFTPSEDRQDSEPVAVVSQAFADRFFPDDNAIGTRIRLGRLDSPFPWMEIVGIVGDIQTGSSNPGGLGSDAVTPEAIYVSLATFDPFGFLVAMRTAGPPESYASRARTLLSEIDSNLPMSGVRTMEEAIAQTNWAFGLFGSLFTVFGGVALFLAAVGLYGVLAFSVARRKQEMGVRMALGADGGDIVRLVLRGGLAQLGLGVGLGLLLAVGLSQPLRIALFGVDTKDPAVYLTIVGTLALTGLVATLVPALRATRMDPTDALHQE